MASGPPPKQSGSPISSTGSRKGSKNEGRSEGLSGIEVDVTSSALQSPPIDAAEVPDVVMFRSSAPLKVGEMCRYTIEYTPRPTSVRKSLWVRVHNKEMAALRAAYLQGPYTLYCDFRPATYNEREKVGSQAQEPKYDKNVKAGQHFDAELLIMGPHTHKWTIDVICEVLFSTTAKVEHMFTLATSKHAAKSHHEISADPCTDGFKVNVQDTTALWMFPLPRQDEPLHLCVLTHGLVSNVTADMYYVKEEIEEAALAKGENLICRGYTGNVCKTEQGVKRLGRRLADWLMYELIPTYKPAKMSFVGHSLGGLVQSYALGYIEKVQPGFFAKRDIELINFIALATPFLGISSENPGYVRMALDFGFVGKSGRDLGLSWIAGKDKPLLETLPNGPLTTVLKGFRFRTIYANSVNDGIVPLRTASLLYLDWRAISKAAAARDGTNAAHFQGAGRTNSDLPAVQEYEGDESSSGQSSEAAEKAEKAEKEKRAQSARMQSTWNPFANPFARKQSKIIEQSQVGNQDDQDDAGFDKHNVHLPKKASLFESGLSVLLPPHPDHEFINNPDAREDVIFHDRVYYEHDLPPRRFRTRTSLLELEDKKKNKKVEVARKEEKMARAWHHDKSWRKVLVQLLPDAHNNIIVRRRFSNAYGWPVVRHMVQNHFAAETSGCEEQGPVEEMSAGGEKHNVRVGSSRHDDGDEVRPVDSSSMQTAPRRIPGPPRRGSVISADSKTSGAGTADDMPERPAVAASRPGQSAASSLPSQLNQSQLSPSEDEITVGSSELDLSWYATSDDSDKDDGDGESLRKAMLACYVDSHAGAAGSGREGGGDSRQAESREVESRGAESRADRERTPQPEFLDIDP